MIVYIIWTHYVLDRISIMILHLCVCVFKLYIVRFSCRSVNIKFGSAMLTESIKRNYYQPNFMETYLLRQSVWSYIHVCYVQQVRSH